VKNFAPESHPTVRDPEDDAALLAERLQQAHNIAFSRHSGSKRGCVLSQSDTINAMGNGAVVALTGGARSLDHELAAAFKATNLRDDNG
jgi:mRNA-degrading endonuclease toxin of MazEF toxin-antitoxin module